MIVWYLKSRLYLNGDGKLNMEDMKSVLSIVMLSGALLISPSPAFGKGRGRSSSHSSSRSSSRSRSSSSSSRSRGTRSSSHSSTSMHHRSRSIGGGGHSLRESHEDHTSFYPSPSSHRPPTHRNIHREYYPSSSSSHSSSYSSSTMYYSDDDDEYYPPDLRPHRTNYKSLYDPKLCHDLLVERVRE